LGCYQYYFGSVLKYLRYHVLPASPEANVETLFADIKAAYRDYGTKYTYDELKVAMFWAGGDNFPSLKGKAAEVKDLTVPLLVAAHKHLDAENDVHKLILKGLEMCTRMEELLERHKDEYRFPIDARAEFRDAAHAFYQINTSLARHFHPHHIVLFHHAIKFHYALHLGLAVDYINPRLSWCYSGEDFMMKVKLIVQACYSGTAPILVPPKVMAKYIQGLGLKLAAM
jgi:hypothetical protein